MNGGIFNQDGNNKTEKEKKFFFFLQNSKVEIFKSGLFGMTFIATLNKNIKSPYLHSDLKKIYQPVLKILFKLSFVGQKSNDDEYETNKEKHKIDERFLKLNLKENFEKEIKIQQKIQVLSSAECLQSICPHIITTLFINSNNVESFLNNLKINNKEQNKEIEKLKLCVIKNIQLGLIVMEFADNYETLHSIINKDKERKQNGLKIYSLQEKNKALHLAIFALYQLLVDYKINHNDYHMNNILINMDETDYLYNSTGRILIIDFGKAYPFHTKNKNIIHVLTQFMNTKISNGRRYFEWKPYAWVNDVIKK